MGRTAGFTCCLLLALAGCGSDRATRGEGTLTVVATTEPVADLVRNAGGRRVQVTALVADGADPHSWRPGRAARRAAADADLLVRSGGALDAWAADLPAERELELLPRVDPLGGDPHWWQDPVRAQRAVKEIRNELARADVDGAGYYETASAGFLARLRRLDREIAGCVAQIGAARRLVAQHDGFAYLNERYGLDVVGPRERAPVGRRLWADALGPPGTAAGTYVGAIGANVATIVDALTGGVRHCRPRG